MKTIVRRFSMAHPTDVSQLAGAFDAGEIAPEAVVAVIGKTEGNGGIDDFTRGYLTQSLMLLLAARTGRTREELVQRIPCILCGGTEGVLSPHYVVLARDAGAPQGNGRDKRLAIGVASSAPTPVAMIGRAEHAREVSQSVRQAMREARVDHPADVRLVLVKCPIVTAKRARAARALGATVATADVNRSMQLARVAGAFGVAFALGEIRGIDEAAFLTDFSYFSRVASISSDVDVLCNEVVVLGNSAAWSGDLGISSGVMRDALDINGIYRVLADLGIRSAGQVTEPERDRIAGVVVKCGPERLARIHGNRHTVLDDTAVNTQRHIRGAIGGLVAAVMGDTRLFVSGGAEHQGPDGGGLIAVIARV